MIQQTSKIVHLSKEIFQAHAARLSLRAPRARMPGLLQPPETQALRAQALAALAKETGNTATIHKMETPDRLKPLTRYQVVELEALIFYAAQQEGLTPARVGEETARFLGLSSLQNLSVMDYRCVRDYLWQRLKTDY